jgi:hypothetical protein
MAIPHSLAKNDFQARARLLLQPINLRGLIRRGILAKKGAWYRVLKFNALPVHARAQVCQLIHDPKDNGSLKIKFTKLSRRGRAELKKVLGMLAKS